MNDNKLARIRKLLAQAEDPAATAEESEAFNAKAAELMARHGVDAALLAAADPSREVVGDLSVELLAPYAYEKGTLGATVARGLRCSAVLRKQQEWRQDALPAPLRPHDRPDAHRDVADQPDGPGHGRASHGDPCPRRACRRLPPHLVAGIRIRDRSTAGGGRGEAAREGPSRTSRRRARRRRSCSPTAPPWPSRSAAETYPRLRTARPATCRAAGSPTATPPASGPTSGGPPGCAPTSASDWAETTAHQDFTQPGSM